MTRATLLALTCLTLPALAEENPKKETKKVVVAVSADELVKQAEAKSAAGDVDGAIELLRKAQDAPGATGDVALRLGRALETKQDLDGAMDAYQAAAGKLSGPPKGEALARLALALETRGGAEAGANAEAAAAADPGGLWPTIALSRARARAGQGDEAVALAEKAVAAAGGGVAQAARGFAKEAKSDWSGAEAAYREALAAPEAKVVASVGLARVLRRTGRAAEAAPLLAQALEASPGAVEAYKESARVKLALNRPDEAMGDAQTAAALAEGDKEAARLAQDVSVAKALAGLSSNLELAIRDLSALRDQDPSFAGARVGLAKALIAKRQPDAALLELQKAVEVEPQSADAFYQLGFVQHALKGNPTAAVAAYRRAVSVEPGNAVYRTSLGAALSDAKDYDGAVAELQKVTAANPGARADAWIYLGRAHLGAKRYKDAIPALEKAATLAPSSADAVASLAWCYFGLKDAESFKKHAGKAKSLGYKEPTLLQYLQRIEAGEPIK